MACDICGRKATTDDGMVGAYLCDDPACLDVAWDAAEWPATAPQGDERPAQVAAQGSDAARAAERRTEARDA